MHYAHEVQACQRRSYSVRLVEGLLNPAQRHLADTLGARRVLLVTTPTVARLYSETLLSQLANHGCDISMLVLDVQERSKVLGQVERICQEARRLRLARDAVLLGVGGGVCTDVTTVAASWIRRGIRHIRVPTTLIGQVDAGIGVKGAVNFVGKKNYLGCFYPPESVVIDPAFLQTLAAQHLRAGLSEIIKIALVRDENLFCLVEEHTALLVESCFAKPRRESREVLWISTLRMLEELEPNIYEDQTSQRLVDFGHTFSPLLEAASGFSLSHGEAVAIDMALTCAIATELGWLSEETRNRIIAALVSARLPIHSLLLTKSLCENALEEAILHRAGCINLVVPTDIGRAVFLEQRAQLPLSVLSAALTWLAERARPTSVSARPTTSCLVFDVGGTSVRGAMYDARDNTLFSVNSRATPNYRKMPGATVGEIRARLLQEMNALSSEVLNGRQPDCVSVAFPGPIDSQGKVLAAPTVWGTSAGEPIDLVAELQRVWPTSRILLINDVTAAGYRYLQNEDEDMCIVTVSSGIGNKIFIKGQPITGPAGHGGEIGHVQVDFSDDAPLCDCGGLGHLGAVASGRGTLIIVRREAKHAPMSFANSVLARRFRENLGLLQNEDIAEAFRSGDAWTVNVIRQVALPLGQMLSTIHFGTGTERFVIIGGFALALGESYRLELVKAASRCGWQIGQNWNSMIELGEPDDYSGLIGAGRYAVGSDWST